MFVNQIYLNAYSANGTPTGTFNIKGPDATIQLDLTEQEALQLTNLALNFFEVRQQNIARSVSEMRRPLLAAPNQSLVDVEAEEAEVTPVPSDVSDDDGIPF